MRIPAIIHSRRGQTLVEALMALGILTMGFLGIATLLTKSFQLNRTVTNDTQATYLAAEGIELAKNLIDHDVYAGFATGGPGTDDFGACFPQSGYYYPIDYKTTDCSTLNYAAPSAPPSPTPLYLDPNTGFFTKNSSGMEKTDFTRSVEIIDTTNTNGTIVDVDVRSTVTWASGQMSDVVTLEDHFYNWHP